MKAPTSGELTQLAHTITRRVGRFLERQGLLERDVEAGYLAGEARASHREIRTSPRGLNVAPRWPWIKSGADSGRNGASAYSTSTSRSVRFAVVLSGLLLISKIQW